MGLVEVRRSDRVVRGRKRCMRLEVRHDNGMRRSGRK